ncbi:MAG TPA: hypothetical protein PKC87_00610 [Candidatus Absconditabacterales bacterium]|nr:hypothetical protein [Candidatus Absconditabacterales bacterium]
MKKIDPEKLFASFIPSDEDIYTQHGVEYLFDDNLILLATVIVSVDQYFILEKIYENRYRESFSPIREKIKLKYFKGLVKYLRRIDLSKGDKLLQLQDEFEIDLIRYSLDEMLSFFETLEYYEDCALILKFKHLFFPKG